MFPWHAGTLKIKTLFLFLKVHVAQKMMFGLQHTWTHLVNNSWWLNQPGLSNWIISPNRGKIENIWNHQLEKDLIPFPTIMVQWKLPPSTMCFWLKLGQTLPLNRYNPENQHVSWKLVVGRLLSFRNGPLFHPSLADMCFFQRCIGESDIQYPRSQGINQVHKLPILPKKGLVILKWSESHLPEIWIFPRGSLRLQSPTRMKIQFSVASAKNCQSLARALSSDTCLLREKCFHWHFQKWKQSQLPSQEIGC